MIAKVNPDHVQNEIIVRLDQDLPITFCTRLHTSQVKTNRSDRIISALVEVAVQCMTFWPLATFTRWRYSTLLRVSDVACGPIWRKIWHDARTVVHLLWMYQTRCARLLFQLSRGTYFAYPQMDGSGWAIVNVNANVNVNLYSASSQEAPLMRSMCRVLIKKTRLQCTTKTVNLHVRLTQIVLEQVPCRWSSDSEGATAVRIELKPSNNE